MTQYYSITSIMKWAGVTSVQYLGDVPYVYTEGMYHYFGQRDNVYVLLMTSLDDLAEMIDE